MRTTKIFANVLMSAECRYMAMMNHNYVRAEVIWN